MSRRIQLLVVLSAVAAVVALATAAPARADDTGLKGPTACTTGATGNPPSNAGQALVDDVATGATSDALCALFRTNNPPGNVADSEIYYNFSLDVDVPSGATIDGIEVVVSGYRTAPAAETSLRFNVRLSGGGGLWTAYKETDPITSVDAEYTLGGGSEKWYAAWTWTDGNLTDDNFKLEIVPTGPSLTGEHWKLDSVRVKVYYTPAASPFEGLSHGYWKNHLGDWDATGYASGDLLGDVFAGVLGSLEGKTLSDALAFHGGDDLEGAQQILLRNAVASLLNAAHPKINYPLALGEVIAVVNEALATNDRDTILDLEEVLDAYNNLDGDITK